MTIVSDWLTLGLRSLRTGTAEDGTGFTLGADYGEISSSTSSASAVLATGGSGDGTATPIHPALDRLVQDGVARTANFGRYYQAQYPAVRDAFSDPQNSQMMDRLASMIREYNALAARNPEWPKMEFYVGVQPTTIFSGGAASNALDYIADKNVLNMGISFGQDYLDSSHATTPPQRRGGTAIPTDTEKLYRPPEIALSNELMEQISRMEIILEQAKRGESPLTGQIVSANIVGAASFQEGTWAIDSVLTDYAYQTTSGDMGATAVERDRTVQEALKDADPAELAKLLNDAAGVVADGYSSNPYVDVRDWVDNVANYDPTVTPYGTFGIASTVREGARGHIETLGPSGGGQGITVTSDGAITLGNARDVAERQLQNHLDMQLPPELRGKIDVEFVERDGQVLPSFVAR